MVIHFRVIPFIVWAACNKDAPADKTTETGIDTDADLSCADLDAGDAVPFVIIDNTAAAGAELLGSCGGTGEDLAVAFRAPVAGEYLFDTHLSIADTVVYVLDSCDGTELGCDNDGGVGFASHLAVSLTENQPVLVVVDGEAGGGPFTLTGTLIQASESSCDDGYDDDGDQLVDCVDPDCTSCARDCPVLTASEFPGAVSGATTGAPDQVTPSCAIGPSSDVAIAFDAPATGRYAFALSTVETPFDSALVLLDGCGGAELGCADVGGNGGEALAVDLQAGEQVIAVIDGYTGDYGPFTLAVFSPSVTEQDCADGLDEDLDGLTDCADPDCVTEISCAEDCDNGLDEDQDLAIDCFDPDCNFDVACAENCTDSIDQDLDGLIDCADPGCDFDPGCPEDCSNDTDDDGDGFIDCDDGVCIATSACGGDCPDLELPAEGTLTGSTIGADDTLSPTCGGPGSPESTVAFTPLETATYVFDTFGSSYDTVLAIYSDCEGQEVACSDDAPDWIGPSLVALPITSGDTVIAAIDGLLGGSGDWVLNISRAPDDELDCTDGLDNNYDGNTDCADNDCLGEPGCDCPDDVLSGSLPIATSGTTSGASALSGSCGYASDLSPEQTFSYTASSTGDVTFSTQDSSFDTVLYILDDCGGYEIACSDDAVGSTSEVLLPMTSGQTVIVVIDGYGGESGAYELTVQ